MAAVVQGILAGIIMISTLMTLWIVGPEVETALFPVVGPLHVDRIEPFGSSSSKVWVSFDKKRSCDYVGIAWYRGVRASTDGVDRVSLQILREPEDTSSPNRPMGLQRSGPWIVALPPDEVLHNSFVQLFHRCHPLWTTITDFFP